MLDETVETRRPWRGSPRSCVRAGAFLHFMGIILTVSKLLRYAPAGEYMCDTRCPGRAYITLWRNDYKVILATTEKSKKNLKKIIDI